MKHMKNIFCDIAVTHRKILLLECSRFMSDVCLNQVESCNQCFNVENWSRKYVSSFVKFNRLLAATAALEVQMLVCVSVCHTCYNCTKALKFLVLKDFWMTSG